MTVGETGNTRSTATNVDSFFSLPAPVSVYGTHPTATVQSHIDVGTDMDWYSFTGTAEAFAYFDIDNNPYTFNSRLSLFNSSGMLLASNDNTLLPDPGSESRLDSFLFTFTTSATYFVAVSSSDSSGTGDYTLHITNSAPISTPEPSATLLLGIGLLGLVGYHRWHQKQPQAV
jgi:hypothetical protein